MLLSVNHLLDGMVSELGVLQKDSFCKQHLRHLTMMCCYDNGDTILLTFPESRCIGFGCNKMLHDFRICRSILALEFLICCE